MAASEFTFTCSKHWQTVQTPIARRAECAERTAGNVTGASLLAGVT
jgi:hypothetical protein